MKLRWKHALAAYALVLLVGTIALVVVWGTYDCMICGPSIVFIWPIVFFTALICSLPGFLLFRTVLRDIDDYVTGMIGGAGLGAVAGVILYALMAEGPIWMALPIFTPLGALAGALQLWLERRMDRRWPL